MHPMLPWWAPLKVPNQFKITRSCSKKCQVGKCWNPKLSSHICSGGSEAEMIEQQKVKLREERESVTWRFQVVLEDSKDQMDSNGIYTVLQFFHVLPEKNHQLGHFPQIILQDLIRFASPAFPTGFQLAAGSSTSSDAWRHMLAPANSTAPRWNWRGGPCRGKPKRPRRKMMRRTWSHWAKAIGIFTGEGSSV